MGDVRRRAFGRRPVRRDLGRPGHTVGGDVARAARNSPRGERPAWCGAVAFCL